MKRSAYRASFLLGGYQATFRAIDVSHNQRFGVELDNYTYMSNPDNANKVLATLSPHDGEPPTLPPGGPYWTSDQLALFAQWHTSRNFFSRPKAAPIRVGREGVKALTVFEAA